MDPAPRSHSQPDSLKQNKSDKSITNIDMGRGVGKNSLDFNVCWSVANVKVTPHVSERQGHNTGANERRGQEIMSPE